MNYTFESLKKDGSPRKYVGMWRPTFEQFMQERQDEFQELRRAFERGEGRFVHPTEAPEPHYVRHFWEAGGADRPIYKGGP